MSSHAYIKRLLRAKPHRRRELLKTAPDWVIKFIVDSAHNILIGNIPLTRSQFKKLKRKKAQLRRLSRVTKGGLKAKRNYLVKQKGGILPFIIPAVSAILSGIGTAASIAKTIKTFKNSKR